jgi:hypothetical protein
MTIRKRNDSVKPGCGIDGTEGENFTKQRTDPWKSNPKDDYLSPQGAGVYQDKNADFLRNKDPYEATEGSYSILDEVENQSSDAESRKIRSRGQP